MASGDLNGDGTLQLAVIYGGLSSLGPAPGATSVAIGDFNNDGKADVVVSFFNETYIYLGNGDGTFQNFVQVDREGIVSDSPNAVAIRDFNEDGRVDLKGFPGDTIYGVAGAGNRGGRV